MINRTIYCHIEDKLQEQLVSKKKKTVSDLRRFPELDSSHHIINAHFLVQQSVESQHKVSVNKPRHIRHCPSFVSPWGKKSRDGKK